MIPLPRHWRRYLLLVLAVLLLGTSSLVVGVAGPRFLGAGPDPTTCTTPTLTVTDTATPTGTATATATGTSSPTATATAAPTDDTTAAWPTASASAPATATRTATTTPGPTPTSTPCDAPPCASPVTGTALPCTPTLTATTTPQGMLHASGTQIMDGAGHPVVLRGSQIESGFNYLKQWKGGKMPTSVFTSTVFQAMAQKWHMNVLRVPISNWIYALEPTSYLGQLDQVVAGANAAGLYVILDLHDSAQSGSPYGKGQNVPKTESVAFWKVIAAHYKANPMVLFDPFNEPQTTSWQEWLHGGKKLAGGATEVGFQDLVNAIRGTGAQQIIVLEPGSSDKGAASANGTLAAEEGGWSTLPLTDAIADPNVVYSLHVYSGIVDSAAMQDAKWGPVLGKFPIMYGEWGLIINTYHPVQCRGVAHDQADQVVSAFLNYMDARGASWVAWDFTPFHLIQNTTTFTPTTLDIPWTCGDIHSHAGMGTIVMQHLLQLSNGTGQGSTPTPTPMATP